MCLLAMPALFSRFHDHMLYPMFIVSGSLFLLICRSLCVLYTNLFLVSLSILLFLQTMQYFQCNLDENLNMSGYVYNLTDFLKFISKCKCPRIVKTVLKLNKYQIARLIDYELCARHHYRHINLLIQWKVRSIPFNASEAKRISAAFVSDYMRGYISNASKLTIHHQV